MANAEVGTESIDQLARTVVAEVSPGELPGFRATASRYHADPQATLSAKPKADETLGFGAESVVILVAPFALELAKRVLSKLAQKVGDDVGDSLADRVRGWFGKDDGKKEKDLAPLTAEQLALVEDTARAEAAGLNLPPDQCERLADAVVATLATRT